MDKKVIAGLVVAGIVSALLVVILVSMSFADIDYYEMGFLKSKMTGSVDTDKVYHVGRHYVGVLKTFKIFRADIHTEKFHQLAIFNKEKLEVKMKCSVYYILRPEDLALLHNTYDTSYAHVLRSTVLSAIKGAAPQYNIDEYRKNRTVVSEGLANAAAKVLGGICCRKDCKANKCQPGCKPYSTCETKDQGLFADMRYFLLQNVDITIEQEKRFLAQVLEQEKEDTEFFKQGEKLTRKETQREKTLIENAAKEISQGASAKSALIKSKASVKAKALVSDSRNKGLQIIYTTLNITNEEHKKTLDYVRTLTNSKRSTMYVGFQYMVARP